MAETVFTPWAGLAGGCLIGLAAAMLMIVDGRVAGISGMVGSLLVRGGPAGRWRPVAFLAGLVTAPVLLVLGGYPVLQTVPQDSLLLVAGGLLVGFGTALGNGCTSGHGVCGIARLSPRSLAATATFMAAAIVTVFVARHLWG